MQDKLNKIKDWVKGHFKSDSTYDKGGIKPARDWRVILTTSFIVVIVLGLVAFYFYYEVSKGKLFVVSEASVVDQVKINRPFLDKVIEGIKTRKTQFENIKTGEGVPSDPAI